MCVSRFIGYNVPSIGVVKQKKVACGGLTHLVYERNNSGLV